MPYRLSTFGFKEMMDCRNRVRDLFSSPPETMSEAAQRAVDYFYSELVDDSGAPACALVRFFKTHPFGDLGDELQAVARAASPQITNDVRCLTLLATRGQETAWNSPRTSKAHRAIPLTSVEVVQQAPMIAQLITQIGLPIAHIVRPSPTLMLEQSDTAHNVFYVPRALGSPHIVAQGEFVKAYGIESVVGCGGVLSTGDLFALILFTRVPVVADTAEQFRVIGLTLKIAILPLIRKPLFPLNN